MKIKQTKKNISEHITKILFKWGFTKRGLVKNSRGEWYLFSQIFLILLHLLSPYPNSEDITFPINLLFIFIGIILSINGLRISLKALIDLGDNLTPLPYPMKESILIKNNSYKDSRHPIYKGILLISLGISISSLSIIHLILFISLFYLLKIKALKEEEMLKIKFPEYEDYMKKVPAIMENIKYLDWRS
tara:strand:- start:492 stop:1058 length:567 start_codon:yes stop_codon:yes gene_type:complete